MHLKYCNIYSQYINFWVNIIINHNNIDISLPCDHKDRYIFMTVDTPIHIMNAITDDYIKLYNQGEITNILSKSKIMMVEFYIQNKLIMHIKSLELFYNL